MNISEEVNKEPQEFSHDEFNKNKVSHSFLLFLSPNKEDKEEWLSKELGKEFPFINFFKDDCYNFEDFEIEDMRKQLKYDIGVLIEIRDFLREGLFTASRLISTKRHNEYESLSINFVDRIRVINNSIEEKKSKLKRLNYVLNEREYG